MHTITRSDSYQFCTLKIDIWITKASSYPSFLGKNRVHPYILKKKNTEECQKINIEGMIKLESLHYMS